MPKATSYAAGDTVHFQGKSADGKCEGLTNVTIVNPHSNARLVTKTDKDGREYEGAARHIPTALVSLDRSKRGLPDLQFQAFHHTLKALTESMKTFSQFVMEAEGAAPKPKEPTEVDRLKNQQKSEIILTKQRQSNDLFQAKRRELDNKSREQMDKISQPKTPKQK